MKNLMLSLFAVFAIATVFGQDLIVKRDAEEIEAKVEKITDTHIEYRKSTNLDGPLYEIAKSDVFMIKYENGEKDVFTAEAQTLNSNSIVANPAAPIKRGVLIKLHSNRFAIGNQEFSFHDANRYINDYEVARRLVSGVKLKKAALGFGLSGTAVMGLGLGLYFGADSHYYGSGDIYSAYSMAQAGLAFSIIGGIMDAAAIVLGISGSITINNAIHSHNYGDYSSMRLGLEPTQGGYGMQLTF